MSPGSNGGPEEAKRRRRKELKRRQYGAIKRKGKKLASRPSFKRGSDGLLDSQIPDPQLSMYVIPQARTAGHGA